MSARQPSNKKNEVNTSSAASCVDTGSSAAARGFWVDARAICGDGVCNRRRRLLRPLLRRGRRGYGRPRCANLGRGTPLRRCAARTTARTAAKEVALTPTRLLGLSRRVDALRCVDLD